ncbi:MAG: glutamate-5-semialdehyde dehydrogenase, partial [Nitrospirae bacterium]|nr:glutamate-5-semialdehyde dehydrogenase [Nitrospirota bacterium]
MGIREDVVAIAGLAKEASRTLSTLSTDVKNAALLAMARGLREKEKEILAENSKDVKSAQEKGLTGALIERLVLNSSRIEKMAGGLEEVAALPDPVGETMKMWKRPNGLEIGKRRVPIGVIALIYESRPNVTADAAGLCLKAGNSIIMRGGSEAIFSNSAIWRILSQAAVEVGIPEGSISFLGITDRQAVKELLRLNEYIDLVIPRGGEGLISMVTENSTIPVIKHYKGLCHTYVDEQADLDMAIKIAFNAKVQRPGVCNAMETLLVHQGIAGKFLPSLAKKLESAGVELRGCPRVIKLIPGMKEAGEEDWKTEYLDLILSIKVVSGLKEAIAHIHKYGSSHSEAIVTDNYLTARQFLNEVDAATVYVNASTRFTDGGEFGL